jgi:hypothetical protein
MNTNATSDNYYGSVGGINYFTGSGSTYYLTGSIFAGMSGSGTIFAGISHAGATSALTDVHLRSTLSPFWPLEESFQPAQTFLYWVPTATWLEELKSARHSIDEFAMLQEDWDGYGASSISDQARAHAHHFLNEIEAAPFEVPIPEISPKPTGTISFEWEAPHSEVYIEIGNTRYSGFIKTDRQQPIFLQGHADSVGQQIVALIQSAIAAPPTTSAPTITEIRAQPQWWDERLAA